MQHGLRITREAIHHEVIARDLAHSNGQVIFGVQRAITINDNSPSVSSRGSQCVVMELFPLRPTIGFRRLSRCHRHQCAYRTMQPSSGSFALGVLLAKSNLRHRRGGSQQGIIRSFGTLMPPPRSDYGTFINLRSLVFERPVNSNRHNRLPPAIPK